MFVEFVLWNISPAKILWNYVHGSLRQYNAGSWFVLGEIEVFPGNVAAAHLIYRCLNALSEDGSPLLQANVTGSSTSEDGTTQTITIQIPSQQDGSTEAEGEDEETAPCFLTIQEEEEEGVDTGGITIPAEPDPDPGPSVPGGS